MSQPTIIAYMKPVCGWSNGVRAIFAKYGLEYEDRDIINNETTIVKWFRRRDSLISRASRLTM